MTEQPDKNTSKVRASLERNRAEAARREHNTSVTQSSRGNSPSHPDNTSQVTGVMPKALKKVFDFIKDLGIPLATLVVEYTFFAPHTGQHNLGWLMLLALGLAILIFVLYLVNMFSRQNWSLVFITLLITVFFCVVCLGITYQPGRVSGVVRDNYGNPLIGATVTLRDSLGGTYTVATDEHGFYTFHNLPTGLVQVYHAGLEIRGIVFGDVGGYLDKMFRMPEPFDMKVPAASVPPPESPNPVPTYIVRPTPAMPLTPATAEPPTVTPLPLGLWVVNAGIGANCRLCAYRSECPVSALLPPGTEIEVIAIVTEVDGKICWNPDGYKTNVWLQVKSNPPLVETGCYLHSELAKPKS